MSELIAILTWAAAATASFVLCLWRPRLGLPVSLVFSAAIVFGAIGFEGAFGPSGAFTAGGVLLAALSQLASLAALLIAKYTDGGPTWPRSVARTFFVVVAYLFGFGLVAGLLGPFAVLAAVFVGAGLIGYALIARNARTTHLFSTLAATMRQALPLTTALEIEAGWMKGKVHFMLSRVNHWLKQGMSLSEALRRGYPQCPGFALAEVAVGEEMGQLPRATERIVQQLQRRGRQMGEIHPVNPVYPLVVLLMLSLSVGGLTVFIVPKFMDIMNGIDAPMPALSRWVFLGAGSLVGWVVPTLICIACIWLYVIFRPRNPDRPKLLSRLGDHIKWRLPAWRWFERNYATLQTVTYLRLGLRSGEQLDRAIAQAARLDINECYRRRLRRWLRLVRMGDPVAAAARESGVGASLAWAFDAEVNPGQTLPALEMLESAYRSNYSYRAHLYRYVFWPLVILTLAALVGLLAVSVFLILTTLTWHTMGLVMP